MNEGPAGAAQPPLEAQLARLLFAVLSLWLLCASLPEGLWEDGYFFLRYAHNFWRDGLAAWNPSDGPSYGMTSQLHQLLLIALEPLAPRHLVTLNKVVSALGLFGTALLLLRLLTVRLRPAHTALTLLALGSPLLLAHLPTGLETVLVLCWLAFWVGQFLRFEQGGSSPGHMAVSIIVTYLLRPDVTIIPVGALLLLLLTSQRKRAAWALFWAGAGLSLCLLFFRAYYGEALPLAFYVKSYWSTAQSTAHIQIFRLEKVKNLTQFVYLYLPVIWIGWRGRGAGSRYLLGAAAMLCGYHAFFTIETMGHFSRFYVPAVTPLLAAALLSLETFDVPARTRATAACLWALGYAALKVIDVRTAIPLYVSPWLEAPLVLAMALFVVLAAPSASPTHTATRSLRALSMAALLAICVGHPIKGLALESDRAILLRQIAPRAVFRGLAVLAKIKPKEVYHTDMGAPGILLPRARLTDLDGLLNEELLFNPIPFEDMCRRDRPDAIFVPLAEHYPELREEILESPCYREGYVKLSPNPRNRLALRKDRVAAYRAAEKREAAKKRRKP